jgi:hypothetical protein
VLRLVLVAALGATAAACSSAPAGPELLSWQLADGRDCATAGVTIVEMRTTVSLAATPIASARCSDGFAPAVFTVEDVPADGTLYVDGIDGLGTDLYHGELALDAAPPATGETRTVTLYAAAAE